MSLKRERRYQFRERLRRTNPGFIRDSRIKAEDDELILANGWELVLPNLYGDVILTAARDFQQYLFDSMGISILLTKLGNNVGEKSITCIIQPEIKETYKIQINSNIVVYASNEKGLAHALYFLEDQMTARKAPYLKKGTVSHTFMFSPRMVHSGYGVLLYPAEYLSAIAHAGMDSIIVPVRNIDRNLSEITDFNELISRAAKYGLEVYAYPKMNCKKHPLDEGGQQYFDELYGELFRQCPGFKGIIFVGESVEFPSRDKDVVYLHEHPKDGIPNGRPSSGYWPCCDYPLFLDAVKKAILPYRKDVDIVFWTYNWTYAPEKKKIELIRNLPKGISLLITYEVSGKHEVGRFNVQNEDYTIAGVGPSDAFVVEAQVAKECGIRLYAMTNTGGMTWDFGTIPYVPVPYQWMKRHEKLREASDKYGLCGLMESHEYGFFPSVISDIAKRNYIKENQSMEDSLAESIRMRFGIGHDAVICRAFNLWSKAIELYYPTNSNQYGPFRCGPSYPLCLIKEMKPAFDRHVPQDVKDNYIKVLYPAEYCYTGLLAPRGIAPIVCISDEIIALIEMKKNIDEGVSLLQTIENSNDEMLYLINLGQYISCCIQTGINVKKWYIASSGLKRATDQAEVLKLVEVCKEIIADEYKNAEKALAYLDIDSRLGWEPVMDYVGDSECVRWKMKYLDYVRSFELETFVNGVNEKWYTKSN